MSSGSASGAICLPHPNEEDRLPTRLCAIINAIFYVLRDLLDVSLLARYLSAVANSPLSFPALTRSSGPGTGLLTALRSAERERVGRNAQPSAAIMDAASA